MENWIEELNQLCELQFVCSRFEILLTDGKEKHPTKDFSEQEKIIKILRKFEYEFLELTEYKRQLRKIIKEVFEENTSHKITIMSMAKEMQQLKEENENLKQNIII